MGITFSPRLKIGSRKRREWEIRFEEGDKSPYVDAEPTNEVNRSNEPFGRIAPLAKVRKE